MDTPIALNDLDVAQLFERLGPASDAADGSVAVSGQTRLGDVETWPSPAKGDKNQPEPVRAGFEGWPGRIFPSEDAVGNFGVRLDLDMGSVGFGNHDESFLPGNQPPADRRLEAAALGVLQWR